MLTVDGQVTANGGHWKSIQAGGGSGGSLKVITHTLDGAGIVASTGGDGYGGQHSAHGGGTLVEIYIYICVCVCVCLCVSVCVCKYVTVQYLLSQ